MSCGARSAKVKSRMRGANAVNVFMRVVSRVPCCGSRSCCDVIWRMGEAVEVTIDKLVDDAAAVSAACQRGYRKHSRRRVARGGVERDRRARCEHGRDPWSSCAMPARRQPCPAEAVRKGGRSPSWAMWDRLYATSLRRSGGGSARTFCIATVGDSNGAVVGALDRMIAALLGVELGRRRTCRGILEQPGDRR